MYLSTLNRHEATFLTTHTALDRGIDVDRPTHHVGECEAALPRGQFSSTNVVFLQPQCYEVHSPPVIRDCTAFVLHISYLYAYRRSRVISFGIVDLHTASEADS